MLANYLDNNDKDELLKKINEINSSHKLRKFLMKKLDYKEIQLLVKMLHNKTMKKKFDNSKNSNIDPPNEFINNAVNENSIKNSNLPHDDKNNDYKISKPVVIDSKEDIEDMDVENELDFTNDFSDLTQFDYDSIEYDLVEPISEEFLNNQTNEDSKLNAVASIQIKPIDLAQFKKITKNRYSLNIDTKSNPKQLSIEQNKFNKDDKINLTSMVVLDKLDLTKYRLTSKGGYLIKNEELSLNDKEEEYDASEYKRLKYSEILRKKSPTRNNISQLNLFRNIYDEKPILENYTSLLTKCYKKNTSNFQNELNTSSLCTRNSTPAKYYKVNDLVSIMINTDYLNSEKISLSPNGSIDLSGSPVKRKRESA